MFLIVGFPRSGTTLLTQSLSAHSKIVVPYETDFIIPTAFVFDRIRNPELGKSLVAQLITEATGFNASIGEYLTAERVREIVYDCEYNFGELLEAIYSEVARSAQAQLVGDKSPNDFAFFNMFVRAGGIRSTTKILHVIRDVRDVVVSLKEQGWAQDIDLFFSRFWNLFNLYVYQSQRMNTARYRLIRYEDLARLPGEVLAGVCSFLDVEFEEAMLDPSNRHPRYRDMPAHSRLYEPITAARIGVYRDVLESTTIALLNDHAREALEAFGYLRETKHE